VAGWCGGARCAGLAVWVAGAAGDEVQSLVKPLVLQQLPDLRETCEGWGVKRVRRVTCVT
jgi:hypothetical protein